MEQNTVTISLEEYDSMKKNQVIFDLFLDLIENAAELNWRCDDMRLDDEKIIDFLKLVYPNSYELILNRLKQEKQKKEGAEE